MSRSLPNRLVNSARFRILASAVMLLGLVSHPTSGFAYSGYYSSRGCTSCHSSSSSTCAGCHTHMGSISGSTDASVYSPGATVTVTISSSGARSGWVGGVLFDSSGKEIASASKASFPIKLTAAAPTTAGTYTWSVGWYGYDDDNKGIVTADSSNSKHGVVKVAMKSFTVSGSTGSPVISLNPTSVSFGSVKVGSSATAQVTMTNTGSGTLTVSAIGTCSGSSTSSEFSWSSAQLPLSIGAGSSQTLTVKYAPNGTGTDSGCLAITSNSSGSANVALSGTGSSSSTNPYPNCQAPTSGHPSDTNCASCHSTNPCGQGSSVPSDHTISMDGEKHKSGMADPMKNCANCHGSQLKGGKAGNCYTCHSASEHSISYSNVMHASGKPHTCVTCHGPNNSGGLGQACADCHR